MGGAGTSATIQVTAITTSGAITSATIVNSGEYTGSIPNAGGAITTANTTGPTGATFNLTFTVEAINIVSGGVDYDVPPTVGIGGNATIGTVTVSGGAVTNIAVSNPGSGYTSIPSVSIQNPNVQDGKIKIQAANTGTSTTFLAAIGLTAGTYNPVTLFQGPHTAYPDFSSTPSGSVYIKTTNPNQGAFWATKIYSASTNAWNLVKAPIYAKPELAIAGLDPAKDGANIAVGTLYVKDNYDDGIGLASEPSLAEFQIFRRTSTGPTTIVSPTKIQTVTFTNTSTFDIKESYQGAFINTATITIQPGDTLSTVVGYINAAGLQYTSATYDNTQFTVTITHSLGGEIRFLDGTHTPLATALGFTAWSRNPTTGVTAGTTNFYGVGMYEPDGYTYEASNWAPLVFEAQPTAPYLDPEDGTLWFDSLVDEVDIMYHNGINWVGYRDSSAFPGTDPNGPQIASEAPTTQSDGTSLVNGDIWISTADLTMYGQNIYVWNGQTLKWVQQDPTDHTTPNGWLFADARWATSGTTETASTIKALLTSNYVDPDSPDPSLYTKGTRLWNLRRSGYNVKKYEANYINLEANGGLNLRYQNQVMDGSGGATPYVTARWVSVSPNTPLGVGSFGQAAQRSFVVKSLKSLIDTSQAIRDTDTLVFNLIACPGYIETLQNLIGLNTDRGQTAFVVGDTPMTLEPTGTALSNWGNNSALAYDNGPDGIVSFDDYAAVYYPSGYTTDNTGNYIVVPPSHMMLRTIAESDQKSYPWFAPAGVRRGAVDNVSSVGYIDDIGEFHPTALPESLRDVLANVKVNPIATLTGSGIITMGQYTRANAASSLDRINVARLVAYIRRQLGILAKPYLFEPNDKITRDEIKGAVSSFFLQLVGQRAIYDFLVVCDESNNTPTRIDQNQLWVDIAIEPVKAVEFIYIPLRLENTGAISAGG